MANVERNPGEEVFVSPKDLAEKEKIRKIFLSPSKEEKWLNQMAQSGQALACHKGFTYFFSSTTPGEFRYKLAILAPQDYEQEGSEDSLKDNSFEDDTKIMQDNLLSQDEVIRIDPVDSAGPLDTLTVVKKTQDHLDSFTHLLSPAEIVYWQHVIRAVNNQEMSSDSLTELKNILVENGQKKNLDGESEKELDFASVLKDIEQFSLSEIHTTEDLTFSVAEELDLKAEDETLKEKSIAYLILSQSKEVVRIGQWSILKKPAQEGVFPDLPMTLERFQYLKSVEKRWNRSAAIDAFAGVALFWMMWPSFYNNGQIFPISLMQAVSLLMLLAGFGCMLMGMFFSLRILTPVKKELEKIQIHLSKQ